MTQTVLAKTWKAFTWLADGVWTLVLVMLAIAFIGSGVFTGKLGLVVCGIGWTVGLIFPFLLRDLAARRLVWLLRIVGGSVFLLGLAIHGGAL